MGGVPDGVVVLGIAVVVAVAQLRPQRVSTEARAWWVLPAVLVIATVDDGGLTDPRHRTVSALLLVATVLAGAAIGVAWAWTARVWRDDDGAYWARGRGATLAVWAVGVLVGAVPHGLAALAGVRHGNGTAMLALAATLLTRSAVVILRTGGLGALLRSAHDAHGGPYGPGHAHGAYGGGHGKEQALR
ncbi:DUF1453 domain-containing protein [Streptomyces sp. Z26]|uniref:DUF1453 domain-containing protein n=1 Tax=Streptomyces sp. Z26 TaxID=2500177 RepID=UPI000EF15F0F|nr:DUF1453 domain-containing protein [Streptomyces sp. Z26]RLL69225.1 DUF1453 domain-containing protein [Streptomyces sp. Z26]